MGIDAAHCNARTVDAGPQQHVAATRDGAKDKPRLDGADGLDQAHMRGDQDHPQARPGQHHRDFRRARQRRQQFSVAGKIMPASLQRFLVEGRRDQRLDPACHRQFGGGAHIFMAA